MGKMKNKRWICVGIVAAGLAVFFSLWLMGVISFADREKVQDENTQANHAEETAPVEKWSIVYGGLNFFIDGEATAYIHDSGCLNLNMNRGYLVQIEVQDKTVDAFWDNREANMEKIVLAGYREELAPERMTVDEREYVRYVLSMEEDNAGRTYYMAMFTPRDESSRFFVCVKYDDTDAAAMNEAEKSRLYNESMELVEEIFADAVLTDQPDDEIGSLWMPNLSSDAGFSLSDVLSEDTLEYGEHKVTYLLPENCRRQEGALIGNNYVIDSASVHFNVCVWENSYNNAEEKAELHDSSGISGLSSQGSVEMGDYTFYYYAYSVMRGSKDEKKYTYNFVAYCDVGEHAVYEISASSNDNEAVMDYSFWTEVMKVEAE
jgi:hypothetical protein